MHHRNFLDPAIHEPLTAEDGERLAAVLRYESVHAMFDDAERARLKARGRTRLAETDVQSYIRPLTEPGALDAALAWYRINANNLGQPGDLGAIETPTLYLWGNEDLSVGRMSAERSAEHVRGPFDFHEIPGAGHFLCDEAPEKVTAAVLQHVQRWREA